MPARAHCRKAVENKICNFTNRQIKTLLSQNQKSNYEKLIMLSALVIGAAGVRADESAFQASLTPDIAVHSKTTEISGLSLNIWGENPQHGVALGFVNGSTGESSGFSWGFWQLR